MSRLTVAMHPQLTDYLIKLLIKNKITTHMDFINEDSHQLAKITNIGFQELGKMKLEIMKSTHTVPTNALTCYRSLSQKIQTMSTNIKNVDALLVGGLSIGTIFEIAGLASAGKTQFCTTIAINLAEHQRLGTLYVDCKGDFSGKRIHKMLTARDKSETDITAIMTQIRVQRIFTAHELIKILNQLLDQIDQYKNYKLLIIDSLPALWWLFHGDNSTESHNLLADATILLRKLAVKHDMVVLVVNLATRMTQIGELIVSSADSTSSSPPTSNSIEVTKPALGKYWQSVPSTRLLIAKTDDNELLSEQQIANNSSIRTIRIIKSTIFKTNNECIVTITNSGMK